MVAEQAEDGHLQLAADHAVAPWEQEAVAVAVERARVGGIARGNRHVLLLYRGSLGTCDDSNSMPLINSMSNVKCIEMILDV